MACVIMHPAYWRCGPALGRPGRAPHPAGALAHRVLQLPGHAEIAELHGPAAVEQQIGRLQVPVHHPQIPVEVEQRRQHLPRAKQG